MQLHASHAPFKMLNSSGYFSAMWECTDYRLSSRETAFSIDRYAVGSTIIGEERYLSSIRAFVFGTSSFQLKRTPVRQFDDLIASGNDGI